MKVSKSGNLKKHVPASYTAFLDSDYMHKTVDARTFVGTANTGIDSFIM